jgi:hypothetical protein
MADLAKIYCAEKARADAAAAEDDMPRRRDLWGRCFAEKIASEWYCCCCGKRVRIVI